MNYEAPNIAFVWHEGVTKEPHLVALVAYKATTHADALEECFALTNHIDSDWRENARVIATGLGLNRSTSVGDFIQLGLHLYRCDPESWTHVAPTKWQLFKALFVI